MHPNDPSLSSFIEVPAGSQFPIQNLPYGVFSTPNNPEPRAGIAIGDQILDLAVLEEAGVLVVAQGPTRVFNRASINGFLALGPSSWSAARTRLSELLRRDHSELPADAALRQPAFMPAGA